ncbi:pyrroline-5-carboxylate reductase [Fluviicola taffensis]|uniref:Pyrroline-5-carboxylate reductase n=1 Tax=Fluviicola taffensis (strain DSM 16823 / NCIMB 13979 / RW262) TaxID=755732 RepID=F2ID91_FLUTR|nr:pyrroline-5-carboxylate reductase [Fluviicola taffensis]AEA45506.1 pyrroline-5-carboxylate reductase [Fluviicola taffensis DSM 16823]
MERIGIVGCGNLGLSLLKGLRKQYPNSSIIASRRNISELVSLQDDLTHFTTNNQELLDSCDYLIIALKPYTIISFLEEHRNFIDTKRHTIISVATGIRIQEIQTALQSTQISVYRGMPNTAADVQESMTALSVIVDPLNRKEQVSELFGAIGETVWIDEQLMESATILGACGIAYALRFIRAMIQGGIEVGFDAKTANKIVNQTVKGAAQLLIQNGLHPEEEIDKVTTPKGCTIVGLNEMEHSGFSSALIKGIVTSYQKIER